MGTRNLHFSWFWGARVSLGMQYKIFWKCGRALGFSISPDKNNGFTRRFSTPLRIHRTKKRQESDFTAACGRWFCCQMLGFQSSGLLPKFLALVGPIESRGDSWCTPYTPVFSGVGKLTDVFRGGIFPKNKSRKNKRKPTKNNGYATPPSIDLFLLYTFLGGGFKFFIFTPVWGRFQFWRAYFSDGLVQPPTSFFCFFICRVFIEKKGPRENLEAWNSTKVAGSCPRKNIFGNKQTIRHRMVAIAESKYCHGNLRVPPQCPPPQEIRPY